MIVLNGESAELPTGSTIRDLLATLGLGDRGIAVAVDGAVVPKGSWHQVIPDGSEVDVVTAVQGG